MNVSLLLQLTETLAKAACATPIRILTYGVPRRKGAK